MKYRFSLYECHMTVDGKRQTLSLCSACGEYHKSNYGFEISAEGYHHSFGGRQKFCSRCSKVYFPKIESFFSSLIGEIDQQKSTAVPSEKTIEIERQMRDMHEFMLKEFV